MKTQIAVFMGHSKQTIVFLTFDCLVAYSTLRLAIIVLTITTMMIMTTMATMIEPIALPLAHVHRVKLLCRNKMIPFFQSIPLLEHRCSGSDFSRSVHGEIWKGTNASKMDLEKLSPFILPEKKECCN